MRSEGLLYGLAFFGILTGAGVLLGPRLTRGERTPERAAPRASRSAQARPAAPLGAPRPEAQRVLVVTVGLLVTFVAGSSVSSGTKLGSGSSSDAVFSSPRADGGTTVALERVAACNTVVVGAQKLTHIPMKRMIGKTACQGLRVATAVWRQSVS